MSTVAQLKKRIEKNLDKISDLKNKVEQDSKELFDFSLIEIFKRNPSFKSFSWTQYTPYWNDGDTCEFSAHTDYIYVDDEEEGISSYELKALYKKLLEKDKEIKKLQRKNSKIHKDHKIDLEQAKRNWEYQSNLRQIKELEDSDIEKVKAKMEFILDIEEVLNTIDEDTLQSMFGDHAKVTVTSKGATTEDYSHD